MKNWAVGTVLSKVSTQQQPAESATYLNMSEKSQYPVKSHMMAHGPNINPTSLAKILEHDSKLGYEGIVLVPFLMEGPIKEHARVLRAHGTKALMCGINPGGNDNPDPLLPHEYSLAQEKLDRQFQTLEMMCEEDVSYPLMVGPLHTKHRGGNDGTNVDGWCRWMEILQGFQEKYGAGIAIEPLNRFEDQTLHTFQKCADAARDYELGLHLDTGHLHAHGLDHTFVEEHADWVRLFEFANKGRHPLQVTKGIDFKVYFEVVKRVGQEWLLSDEPFDPSVIAAFELEQICDTKTPGPTCLERNAEFLRAHGFMNRQ